MEHRQKSCTFTLAEYSRVRFLNLDWCDLSLVQRAFGAPLCQIHSVCKKKCWPYDAKGFKQVCIFYMHIYIICVCVIDMIVYIVYYAFCLMHMNFSSRSCFALLVCVCNTKDPAMLMMLSSIPVPPHGANHLCCRCQFWRLALLPEIWQGADPVRTDPRDAGWGTGPEIRWQLMGLGQIG